MIKTHPEGNPSDFFKKLLGSFSVSVFSTQIGAEASKGQDAMAGGEMRCTGANDWGKVQLSALSVWNLEDPLVAPDLVLRFASSLANFFGTSNKCIKEKEREREIFSGALHTAFRGFQTFPTFLFLLNICINLLLFSFLFLLFPGCIWAFVSL